MLPVTENEFPVSGDRSSLPLYERVKEQIKEKIASGEWLTNHRIPSENEIVDMLGISRMTANRALRELATEGVIVRVQGRGSFVAPKKRSAGMMGVRNIADEIKERGSTHRPSLILAQTEVCGPDLATALEIAVGAKVFHSIIVHHEDDVPIQLEDRFVNAEIAPDYLMQDFNTLTPNAYLTAAAPISRTEQFIEAASPQPWECKLMAISRNEPCLLVRRRTWSSSRAVTSVRLLYPGSRYRLESQYPPPKHRSVRLIGDGANPPLLLVEHGWAMIATRRRGNQPLVGRLGANAPPNGSSLARCFSGEIVMANGNGTPPEAAPPPQLNVLAQYTKDLSFENPNAPAIYQNTAAPQIDVQFNIGTAQIADELHEVVLKIEIKAEVEGNVAFVVDFTYGGLFGLRNVPADAVQPFLLGEAPRLMFPFARRIVADATRDGGFPPLLLEPIDFNGLYMQQAAQRAQDGEPTSIEGVGNA